MAWWRDKPPPPALIEDDKVNLKTLSPLVAGMLKACLGALDTSELEHGDREQVRKFYDALDGPRFTLEARGMYSGFTPVVAIKAKLPNPRRQ